MDYQISLNPQQHGLQIHSNVQSSNSQILHSVQQQSLANMQNSIPLPPLNSLPTNVNHNIPQILNGNSLSSSQSLNIENAILQLNSGNSENTSQQILHHHLQNLNSNESSSNNGVAHSNSSTIVDANNNNINTSESNRWTHFQVQHFWKHNIQCKSGNKECADEKFKEDGDPWSVEAQAAFLGPILWDKTLPYDADLKVPQYEDLDEFLSENNMPDGLTGGHIGNSAGFSHRSDSLGHSAVLSLGLGHVTKKERSPSPSDCISPDTLNPPSPAESTFSFASSGRDFDPRTRAFSDEELKPQPMIKKSRKQFVPDELKDDKYWARRRKNNIAAKRSRDARRQKENQIAMRARYLEKENATLHQEVEQLKQENMDLRSRLSKYNEV